jgi:putative MATE family efflux protein
MDKSQSQTYLVSGNLWQAIWQMSWPLLLTTIANSLVSLTDVKVAGYLGSENQAAVGLAEHIIFIFMIFSLSLGVGATAIVSRAFGAKAREEVILTTGQSLLFAMAMGTILTLAAQLTATTCLHFYCKSPAVLQLGQIFLNAYSLVLLPYSITVITNALFRAVGNSKVPLLIVTFMTIINITLDICLVIYNWPVKGLGIVGMAYAALFASSFGALLALFLLSRSLLKEGFRAILPLDKSTFKRLIAIGLPSAFHRLGWALSVFVVFFILARCPYATDALAAWTIGIRVESLIYMPLMALSLAVSSIVGQNLGAGARDRAYLAGWRVTTIGITLMSLLGMVLYFGAEQIARYMTSDNLTIAYTTSYLKINALAEPFLALGMVLTGALQGAGDSKTPMWFTFITNWLVRLPLAFLLSLGFKMGPDGVWWSMVISIILQGILTTWRYQGKSWLDLKI